MKKVSISEEDRLVCPLVIDCGYIGENKFEKLEFVIPKEYKKYNKKLNFRLKDGTDVTRLFDEGTDNIFTITSDLAIYDVLSCCVVFFSIENDDEIIGKSSIFKIKFDKTIPDEDISDYEPKVVILDGLISRVNELEKTVTENEKRREEYIDDLKQRVDNGEFNGKDALINGVNTLNIVAGDNISLEQTDSTLTISGTYEYDDTNVKAAIAENTRNISNLGNKVDQNTKSIESNTAAINTNKQAIESNTTAIQENKTNIDTNTQDINNLKQKSDDNKNSIDEINENLKNYSLITETGNKIDVTVNSSTYVMTLDLKDKNDNVLSTGSVDLPIESMIINVTYDSEKKELKFTLQNGNIIEVPLNDLISGLVTDESLENTLKRYALIKDVPTRVSQLENDLDYVKNTDYATSTVAGVVKTNAGLDVDENGMVIANTYNYDEYESKTDNTFISKGTLENVKTGKNLETANNKVTSVGTGSTDIEYPSAKCVYKIKEDLENRLTGLEENVSKLIDDAPIYGIQRNIADNSDTAWERTDDAVGLVANATHDGTEVRNDFDNIYPWSHMKTVNYDPTEEMITATIGDSNFKFDGSNGQVMTIIPEFYLKHWDDGIKEHWQFSRYALEGFTKVPGFMLGRYVSGRTADNKLMSASGLFPEVLRTITAFRTDSRAVGKDFGQMDWRYFVVQLLYLVEYADYNSQAKLGNGYTNLRVSNNDKALVAETNANRIIIDTANANYFKVGQAISIGTSGSWNWEVARNRIITSITDYSEGDITGKAINFDGSPVNIAIGNAVWSTGQKSGECDSLGMKSGCLANDSKSAVIYRGLENIFGNVWQFVDGINIKDYVAYVCYNPENYAVDKFDGDYKAVDYVNANKEGWGKTLGHDANHPLVTLTTDIGGGSSNYLSDYYYSNSGNRVVRVGGTWFDGAKAGLWCWSCVGGSSITSYNIGSRLLKETI